MSEADAVEVTHDTINEMIVVAAALTDATARAKLLLTLRPELFVDDQHRAIWEALVKLDRAGVPHDLVTVHAEVSQTVQLAFMQQLVAQYPDPPAALDHHVQNLRWDSARAEGVQGPVADFLKALRDPTSTQTTIRSKARHVGTAFDGAVDNTFMKNRHTLAAEAVALLKARATMGVYPFGLPGVDIDKDTGKHRLIPGTAPDYTTILTGVSGSGKSVLAAVIALAQARTRRKVLYGAWEMGPHESLMLLAMLSCGFNRYDLTTGNMKPAELAKLHRTMENLGKYVSFFDPPFSGDLKKRYSNDDALDMLCQQINDSGCDIFIADLWERAVPDGDPGAERRALFRQQQIAKECHCHQILLAQQKLKDIEKRPNKRPTRDTILGSSAWVDVADTILGVHRPKLWDPFAPDTMEVLILKQRYATWPHVIEHDWDGNEVTLKNPREIPYEDPTQAGQKGGLFG